MKKRIRESADNYLYKDDEDICSSRQVKDLFKRELFHPTRDYSRQMKQAMAYTIEKNLHEKRNSKVKDTLKESENVNPYGFIYKDTVITDRFGNYWTMDTWVNGLSEPYEGFDDAEASMLICMEDCGLPTTEDVPDAENYAYEFTKFAATVVPNYIVGYEPTASASNDRDRVHSFAFDFIITDPTLGSAAEARDRILNEIELVEGIQIVGNPNVDATSWSKDEYGLSESAKKCTTKKNLKESEDVEDLIFEYSTNQNNKSYPLISAGKDITRGQVMDLSSLADDDEFAPISFAAVTTDFRHNIAFRLGAEVDDTIVKLDHKRMQYLGSSGDGETEVYGSKEFIVFFSESRGTVWVTLYKRSDVPNIILEELDY